MTTRCIRGVAGVARIVLPVLLAWAGAAAAAQDNTVWSAALAEGTAQRRPGNLTQALESLEAARRAAKTPYEQAVAAGELGAALAQARRLDEAEPLLNAAYAELTGDARARIAADLGNLEVLRKHPADAERYYREARSLARNASTRLTIDLNLARIAPAPERLHRLELLYPAIAALPDSPAKARLYLGVGTQARGLGPAAVPLAWGSLDRAGALLATEPVGRAHVETLDALAQLYEDQKRAGDALHLTQQALAHGERLPPGAVADLVVNLEWRQGRLYRAAGDHDRARAAFERAVDRIEAVRQDIPIDYDDGRSSFQATLAPIYLGLVELLLQAADEESGSAKEARLRRTIAVVELLKQAEMQDFLGDRCAVEATHRPRDRSAAATTAVLYPILLPERVELILERESALLRRTVSVRAATVQSAARAFAEQLRNGEPNYLAAAGQLYNWLLAPFDAVLAQDKVDTLVFVPDGALRLVPIGVLHDGKQFVLERMATATVIGMSMTNGSQPLRRRLDSLVAGMSVPGPVVGKLDDAMVRQIQGGDEQAAAAPAVSGWSGAQYARSARRQLVDSARAAPAGSEQRLANLREALALPGVKEEVESVSSIVKGRSLLDSGFTIASFRSQAGTGLYQIVHIASHGVFGGSASSSFIMTYDDLLTLDGLQAVLRSEKLQNNPVELLSLSACETAEGDDRSPLGISGAAIKAHAKSVLGTLWPVDDRAARTVMEIFYERLNSGRYSKAEALRGAQLEVMKQDGLTLPFYWAPFILIGNWL